MSDSVTYRDLKGKTFIVTGAASGIGRQIALQLSQQGANIGLLDLRKPDDVLKEITASGGKAISVACNVQETKAVHAAVEAVAKEFGNIDGAANMAGSVGTQGLSGRAYAMDVISDEDWDFMLATNLNGVKNSIRAELNLMKGPGSIVNAASISGQQGTPWSTPYNVSKWGVIGMTKCTAQEVGTRNIRVNAVAPGIVNTPLTQSLGSPEELQAWLVPKIALRKLAEPDEVARVIVFLLSEQAQYITGSVVNVDGGFLM